MREGVGVMKDKEPTFEEIESSHTLGESEGTRRSAEFDQFLKRFMFIINR